MTDFTQDQREHLLRHGQKYRYLGTPYLINVSINLRVVVDVNAWWAEYGYAESPREIRETIKAGALDAVRTGAFGHLTHVLRVEEA